MATEIGTDRLWLRSWRSDDREPFAVLNGDPEVMEHFPSALSRAESDALVDRIEAFFVTHPYGLWAIERRDTHKFIGFAGLSLQTFEAHFTPAIEVGWRLAREDWGHGFATEAGRAAIAHGFQTVGLPEIVSFTGATNLRSRGVMERLGMISDPGDDFDHPRVPVGHPLRHHVLYRLSARAWSDRGA